MAQKLASVHSSADASSNADISIDDDAVDYLSTISDGDARTALNCLEIAISKHAAEGKRITDLGCFFIGEYHFIASIPQESNIVKIRSI